MWTGTVAGLQDRADRSARGVEVPFSVVFERFSFSVFPILPVDLSCGAFNRMRISTESQMTKLKFVSATLIAAIAASANDNKRARGYRSVTVMQDASSATAAQRSGATLQGGAGDSGSAGGVGG